MEPLHPSEEPPDIDSFDEWDLGEEVQGAISGMGIVSPTPIQALAIGPILEGRDVIAKAETGTGKTLAFGAPIVARIDPARASVLAVILSPTRELAEQVFSVMEELGETRGVKAALIVGGEPLGPQVHALQAGAQVVVGTPGRVLDLMQQGFLSFPWTEFAVLDEADKMLEIGFLDDVTKILDATPDERQTLCFSATFPPPLLKLARGYTSNPAEIATAKGVATVDTITQYYFEVSEEDRALALAALINNSGPDDVFLVFCDRRTDVDWLIRRMERERFSVKALHGGYDQASRFRVMAAFRTGDVKALIATDVASRGLDVQLVTHVVNYGVPRDTSDYTHRIGRTGRAGRQGTSVTFVGPQNARDWDSLVRQMPWDVAELPVEHLGGPRRGGRGRSTRDEGEGRSRSRTGEERGGRERSSSSRGERGRGERPERSRRSESSERNPRSESPERSSRRESSERSSRSESPERSSRSERPERNSRSESPERSSRSESPERSSRSERPERSSRSERPERNSRSESPERGARRTSTSEDRGGGRKRDERPARRESEASTPKPERGSRGPSPAPGSGSFGAGLSEAPAPAKKPREKKPARKPREPKPAARQEPPPPSGSGFGTGI